jgi:peptidoglycan/xylan/chitin deacetylase (PgdA/CDA1 family)
MRGIACPIACLCIVTSLAAAQARTVAITVDDLPYEHDSPLVDALRRHKIPVTGFVIQTKVEALGAQGPQVLKRWTTAGFELGNHSYSHPDFNILSIEQIEDQIIRGEAGRNSKWFRFPENHTGDTKEKHDAVAAFLATRGYRLATCTIDTSDYVFAAAYARMPAKGDRAARKKLRAEYLAYSASEIDYYAAFNRKVLGYEPPEVMLLHDNALNSEMIEPLIALFQTRHYRFVTLKAAQSDAAYQIPDTYITKFGPMWGYRWAAERNVKYDGSLEPDPPIWIVAYK